jgi:hypothetical protein
VILLIDPIELEIKDTTYAARSASYLDPRNEHRLRTKLYDKRVDFNIPIVTFHLYVATFQHYLHME